MEDNVQLWDLIKVVKKIAIKSVLAQKWLQTLAYGAALSTIVSTYFIVKVAHYSSALVREFRGDKFDENLRGLIFVSIASIIFRYVPNFAYTYVMQYIMRREYMILTREYLRLSYEQFHKKTPGELRYLVFLNAYAIPMVTQTLIFELSRLIGMCWFVGIQTAGTVNIWTAIAFLAVPVGLMTTAGAYLRLRLKQQSLYLKEQEKMSSVLYDKLINYELIKTYNLEKEETNEYYKSTEKLGNEYIKLGIFDGNWFVFVNFILAVLLVLLVLAASKGDILLQLLLMYTYMSTQLRTMVEQFIKLMDFAYQIKFTEMGCEINSKNKETEFKDNSEYLSSETNEIEETRFKNNLQKTSIICIFQNVNLFYNEQIILKNINQTIYSGEKIAIVGLNGCGKSTFIKSLMGFIQYNGIIEIGGNIISSKLDWKRVRRNISYIPQNNFILNESIMDNIKLGRKSASETEVYEKAIRYGINEDILSLSQGYTTITGPRGNKISGGQQQKLSLVRAALRDAPIFIFDEATAAMDKNYEQFLIDTIWTNLADKTIIMIVHFRNYLHRFNRILFLNNGRVECTGSYDELIASSENFKKFISMQS